LTSELFKDFRFNPKIPEGDFIEDLKKDILSVSKELSPEWVETCAMKPLNTVLYETQIVEQEAPMPLNLFNLMIALTGIGKSKPIYKWTTSIIRHTEKLLDRDLTLPNRMSVEGFIKWTAQRAIIELEDKDEEGKKKQRKGRYLHNVGLIARDEYSGMFRQARKADWQSDALEFQSELYDGSYQKRYTISQGLNEVPEMYACLLSATTPHFLKAMDKQFFIQGTGNRILYDYFDVSEYEIPEIDPIKYFSKSWSQHRERKFVEYSNKLKALFKFKNAGEEKYYEPKLNDLYMSPDAGELWVDFKTQTEVEWKRRAVKNPLGWKYHPLKRYAEFALKYSGIYAVSRMCNSLKTLSEDNIADFTIIGRDMERAVSRVMKHHDSLIQIIQMKVKLIPQKTPKSHDDEAYSMVMVLEEAPNKMLNAGQWFDIQTIVSSPNTFNKYKRRALETGLIKLVIHSQIADKKERERLGADMPATKIYTVGEELC